MAIDIKVLEDGELAREVCVVIGTRPGFVMLAPIIAELQQRVLPHFVIHTGQHYSPNMDLQFFTDLELTVPDYRLEDTDKYATHAEQTAHMMIGIERVLLERKPALVVVGGDANTNLSGALAARKLGIAVAHVEAGERSFDWSMPEEHNRRMIDHISDLLFASGDQALQHLQRESVQGEVSLTGNPIVDASQMFAGRAEERFKSECAGEYGLVTLHREENVDHKEVLERCLNGLSNAGEAIDIPLRWYLHPRTAKRLKQFELETLATQLPGFEIRSAVGYLEFTALLKNARIVFTDSGGVQQEACIHQTPCVTLRENTEWTETLALGANRLAGTDPAQIVAAANAALVEAGRWEIPFGDGRTRVRIVDAIEHWFAQR